MTASKTFIDTLNETKERINAGGQPKYHEKLKEQNKTLNQELSLNRQILNKILDKTNSE